jgi:hypothetical protein
VNTKRGTPHCSTISRAEPTMTVGSPFISRCRATRPTVWWQTGQSGKRSATSTASARQSSRMAGEYVALVRRWL